MWTENGYTSTNILLDSDGEEQDEEKDGETDVEDEEDGDKLDIDYVVGDVTQPQKTGDNDAIVVHCVGSYICCFI